jgi:hypothetical protein
MKPNMIENRIKVIDSPMGTYKTTWAINYIKHLPYNKKVIYITPFLDECTRVIRECQPQRFLTSPDKRLGKGSKSNHLLELLKEERDIAATHSLFSRISDEVIDLLKQLDYILILDEVFNVVDKYDMWKNDPVFKYKNRDDKEELTNETVKSLLALNCIVADDMFMVKWIDDKNIQPKYMEFKNLCDRELIYLINGKLLLWTFPYECFLPDVFKEVYLLTYLFDYQIQYYYFKYYNIPYAKYHMEKINNNHIPVKTINDDYEKEWLLKVKPLINIIDAPINVKTIFYNSYGRKIETALSKTWYNKNRDEISKIKKVLVTFFMNYSKSKGVQRMWTCFDAHKISFKDKNISLRSRVPCNSRATNKYINKSTLAYLINRYLDPFYIHFFDKKNIKLNKDGFAISEFLQWIWRSRIRENKPITLFVASERMRRLLRDFLDGNGIGTRYANEDIDYLEDENDE